MQNIIMLATVPACVGCGKVVSLGNALSKCEIYAAPFAKQHIMGGCPSQTNRVVKSVEVKKVRVGQQKQKTKGAK
jgi:hypothetical protein